MARPLPRLDDRTLGAVEPQRQRRPRHILLPSGAQPGATVTALVERGTGNPLYLRELVAVVCAGSGDAPASLPPSLQAILAARLDALRPEEKGAIQRVSVLGDMATEEQVAPLGLTQAATALRSLVAAGLLRQRQDACYEVADSLLREVAYETLPRQVRGEWHRRAAETVTDQVQHARQLERAAGYLPDDEGLARRHRPPSAMRGSTWSTASG